MKLTWVVLAVARLALAGEPFLVQHGSSWVIGNDIWNVTIGSKYGKRLWYKGNELVGAASGHYVSYNGAASNLTFTHQPPRIHRKSGQYTDIVFTDPDGDLHWVLTPDLAGAYQYFVNRALPQLGEFRTLWRLDNSTFTNGWTVEKDSRLPRLSEIHSGQKVQDETFTRREGGYYTKYDLASFLGTEEKIETLWGVYGVLPRGREGVGSWYIHGGKDYLNGDHLKQELMIHRETGTGDTVQLNMLHGTHFQAISDDSFRLGRTWGPWLWYLNNGSIADARARARRETAEWPYAWMLDSNGYNSRGSISGQITLSDGRPAAGAAVFLGDNQRRLSTLDQGANYYYRTYADSSGAFEVVNARAGIYNIQAWPNGGAIGDVTTVLSKYDVNIKTGTKTELGKVEWKTTGRKKLFQVGEIDRKATGFAHAGPPREHNRGSKCPSNISYTVGKSRTSDWCFNQSKPGSWSIHFDVAGNSAAAALLSISLAAYSGGINAQVLVNGRKVGDLSQRTLGKPDPAIYRSGTLCGEWRQLQFAVPAGILKNGPNTVDISVHANESQLFVEEMADLKVESAAAMKGFMYDSIVLEQ